MQPTFYNHIRNFLKFSIQIVSKYHFFSTSSTINHALSPDLLIFGLERIYKIHTIYKVSKAKNSRSIPQCCCLQKELYLGVEQALLTITSALIQ